MARIYLDHAATSPLRPEAKAAMEEGFAIWANPSSPHAEGRRARAALEDARERGKAALEWEGELIFTSGASEAAALALLKTKAMARLVSAVEHDCILGIAPDAERLPVQTDGALDLEALAAAVQRERPLVAVQHVNSETGNRQQVDAIHRIVGEAGGLLLSDCAQSAGKLPIPSCDMAIISAHKFGGPIGIGALLVRDFAMLEPIGGHERGYRRGTENLPAALGMVAALESKAEPTFSQEIMVARGRLARQVRDVDGLWLPDILCDPVPFITAIAAPQMSASAQVMRLDMAGFAVSQGSACSSGTMKTSHVLAAMGLHDDANRTIRVSLGWNTTPGELHAFTDAWTSLTQLPSLEGGAGGG